MPHGLGSKMPDILESQSTIDEAENRAQADIKADIAAVVAALKELQQFISGLRLTIEIQSKL